MLEQFHLLRLSWFLMVKTTEMKDAVDNNSCPVRFGFRTNFSSHLIDSFSADDNLTKDGKINMVCLLYTSPSPRDS